MKVKLVTLGIAINIAFTLFDATILTAEASVKVKELSPHLVVFQTSSGNVVGVIGDDGAVLVGSPSADSTAELSNFISHRTKSSVRYVVIADSPADESQGDAGWEHRGGFVVMQEKALEHLGGHAMGAPDSLPSRLVKLGVDRPQISFSDVICFDLQSEAVHVIHQAPGHSNSDWLAHFHVANVVYLGPAFPGDGYPDIDIQNSGSLDGLIAELNPWTDASTRIIPMWGEPTTGSSVKEFLEMLTTVRDRVHRLVSQGSTEQQVLASQVTKEFDSRWGHGRTSSEKFIREVFEGESHHNAAPQK